MINKKYRYLVTGLVTAMAANNIVNAAVVLPDMKSTIVSTPSNATPSQAIEIDETDPEEDMELENDIETATFSNAQEIKTASMSNAVLFAEPMLLDSSVGDLWKEFTGNQDWYGSGTKDDPYQISTLSDLVGLSEAVAAGKSFENQYFYMTNDIDLGDIDINNGNWNPIGWYQNKTELSGEVKHKFKGHFDGGENTVTGLKIINPAYTLNNIGLFGAVEGGSISNLTVEAKEVDGGDNVGVLAGSLSGDTIVKNVTVSGKVYADKNSAGDVGGIAGEVSGIKQDKTGTITIENCIAAGIIINSESQSGYAGGIAGNVQKANLIDCSVTTQDGDSDRIQGKGCVGGIVGRANMSNIYNSYVDGTIGGNGSYAIGGIIGKYEKNTNLVVARFAGSISKSNNGTAAHEGTFIGTREGSTTYTYGTEKTNNISYLFTNEKNLVKRINGSNIDRDNVFGKDAHIGYWTDHERLFTTVAGNTETRNEDVYFYEELEDGIRYIVVNKLNNTFSTMEYADGCDFSIDHFAPNGYGAPVRGYLVSIPRIDTRNADGTFDCDVASLTAIGKTTNSYYRRIDKNNPSAVAAGDVINVATSGKVTTEARYQMMYDENEPGKVKPPTYLQEDGLSMPMTYVNGGTYTFEMPACDTELNVEYIKATTKLNMMPEKTEIKIIQTREGDRKKPEITTCIYNSEGVLISKYIGDESKMTPYPIAIHAEHNGEGSAHDRTVNWSVDDMNLLSLVDTDRETYTLKDAYILPNMKSDFVLNILNKKVKEQADSGYLEPIDNTVYQASAVVTAVTNPATSVNNIAVIGNTRVDVSFQILDRTTRRVEGMNLNKSDITVTLTRKLSGNRKSPIETYECQLPEVLCANLYPYRPFYKNVTWKDQQNGQLLSLQPSGSNMENCYIHVRFDTDGKNNPAWIQNVINADNQIKQDDPYRKLSGTSKMQEIITAVSEDQTNGIINANCNVNLIFQTIDDTVIQPEKMVLTSEKTTVDLEAVLQNGRDVLPKSGFEGITLKAELSPKLPEETVYKPYNQKVLFMVSDPDAAVIDQNGVLKPNKDALWIKEALKQYPYEAEKRITVTAQSENGSIKDSTQILLKVKGDIQYTYVSSGGSGGSGGSSGGGGGFKASANAAAGLSGPSLSVSGKWTSCEVESEGNILTKWKFFAEKDYKNEWAYIYNPYAASEKEKTGWFYFDENGYMKTGWHVDADGRRYYLNETSDGSLGRMRTGWEYLAGRWYYFAEKTENGALLGECLKEADTQNEKNQQMVEKNNYPLKGYVEQYFTNNPYTGSLLWKYDSMAYPEKENFNEFIIQKAAAEKEPLCLNTVSGEDLYALAILSDFDHENKTEYVRNERANQIAEEIKNFLNSFDWKTASDYEKACAVAKWITKADYLDEENTNYAYSCLVDHKANCSGFYNAAKLLSICVGLPVSGINTGNHIYPVFLVNGTWMAYEPTNKSNAFTIANVYYEYMSGYMNLLGVYCKEIGYQIPSHVNTEQLMIK